MLSMKGGLFELELSCESVSGCGITIVGSRSSGIAIRSLLPGGIAEKDGRLREGDKLIAINGRQAGLLTCAQVARCLRQNRFVTLRIYRPNYDLLDSNIFYNRRLSNNYMPRSFSTSTDLQASSCHTTSTDIELFDTLTPSPADSLAASCTDLLQIDSRKSLTSSSAGRSNPSRSVSFHYPNMDKLKRFINIIPKYASDQQDDTHSDGFELSNRAKYRSFCDSDSPTSSIDMDSCLEIETVFRNSASSSVELICPGAI